MTDALRIAPSGQPYPERGPWDAVPSTPELTTGWIRRTTSVDLNRPDGFDGPLTVDLRGRDLYRRATDVSDVGDAVDVVVDEVRVTAVIEEWSGELLHVTGNDHPGLAELVGTSVRRGFGRAVAAAFAPDLARRTLLASMLEDLGGALLVSGYAPLRRDALPIAPGEGALRAEMQQDICAGWAVGGALVEVLRSDDISATPIGPTSPPLTDSGGWHETVPPQLETVTRIRSLDVGPRSSDGGGTKPMFGVRAHFRDSYMGDDGPMTMHEYVVHAEVGGSEPTIESVAVEPRVLPWSTCPSAAPSAHRVVGTRVADIPTFVRAEMVGTSTCTHLNSTVRSLADVGTLLALLDRPAPRTS